MLKRKVGNSMTSREGTPRALRNNSYVAHVYRSYVVYGVPMIQDADCRMELGFFHLQIMATWFGEVLTSPR